MKTLRLLSTFVIAGVLIAGIIFDPQPAKSQDLQCGTPYIVRRGDSLSLLAQRVYGASSYFQLIYSANAATIGNNPNLIRSGAVLQIPCIDALAPSVADARLIRRQQTAGPLPPPGPRKIRFVVATDWAPFTDEDQKQGGLVTELTNVAMSMADGSPAYKIDFINDWSAHIQPLLTDHAYDFGIVWFKPNCEAVDSLSDDSKFRCNNLNWSLPVYEQIIGYYTRADHPDPKSHKDLFGLTLCRPSGYSTFMLEEYGLTAPNITLKQPVKTTDCFEGLIKGDYDVVVLAVDPAEGAITKLNIQDKVKRQDHLSYVATLHIVIAKTHPHAKEYLATLDSGIKKLKESGEWFRIVARHMAQYRSKTQ